MREERAKVGIRTGLLTPIAERSAGETAAEEAEARRASPPASPLTSRPSSLGAPRAIDAESLRLLTAGVPTEQLEEEVGRWIRVFESEPQPLAATTTAGHFERPPSTPTTAAAAAPSSRLVQPQPSPPPPLAAAAAADVDAHGGRISPSAPAARGSPGSPVEFEVLSAASVSLAAQRPPRRAAARGHHRLPRTAASRAAPSAPPLNDPHALAPGTRPTQSTTVVRAAARKRRAQAASRGRALSADERRALQTKLARHSAGRGGRKAKTWTSKLRAPQASAAAARAPGPARRSRPAAPTPAPRPPLSRVPLAAPPARHETGKRRARDFVGWTAHHSRRYAVSNVVITEEQARAERFPAPHPSFGVQSTVRSAHNPLLDIPLDIAAVERTRSDATAAVAATARTRTRVHAPTLARAGGRGGSSGANEGGESESEREGERGSRRHHHTVHVSVASSSRPRQMDTAAAHANSATTHASGGGGGGATRGSARPPVQGFVSWGRVLSRARSARRMTTPFFMEEFPCDQSEALLRINIDAGGELHCEGDKKDIAELDNGRIVRAAILRGHRARAGVIIPNMASPCQREILRASADGFMPLDAGARFVSVQRCMWLRACWILSRASSAIDAAVPHIMRARALEWESARALARGGGVGSGGGGRGGGMQMVLVHTKINLAKKHLCIATFEVLAATMRDSSVRADLASRVLALVPYAWRLVWWVALKSIVQRRRELRSEAVRHYNRTLCINHWALWQHHSAVHKKMNDLEERGDDFWEERWQRRGLRRWRAKARRRVASRRKLAESEKYYLHRKARKMLTRWDLELNKFAHLREVMGIFFGHVNSEIRTTAFRAWLSYHHCGRKQLLAQNAFAARIVDGVRSRTMLAWHRVAHEMYLINRNRKKFWMVIWQRYVRTAFRQKGALDGVATMKARQARRVKSFSFSSWSRTVRRSSRARKRLARALDGFAAVREEAAAVDTAASAVVLPAADVSVSSSAGVVVRRSPKWRRCSVEPFASTDVDENGSESETDESAPEPTTTADYAESGRLTSIVTRSQVYLDTMASHEFLRPYVSDRALSLTSAIRVAPLAPQPQGLSSFTKKKRLVRAKWLPPLEEIARGVGGSTVQASHFYAWVDAAWVQRRRRHERIHRAFLGWHEVATLSRELLDFIHARRERRVLVASFQAWFAVVSQFLADQSKTRKVYVLTKWRKHVMKAHRLWSFFDSMRAGGDKMRKSQTFGAWAEFAQDSTTLRRAKVIIAHLESSLLFSMWRAATQRLSLMRHMFAPWHGQSAGASVLREMVLEWKEDRADADALLAARNPDAIFAWNFRKLTAAFRAWWGVVTNDELRHAAMVLKRQQTLTRSFKAWRIVHASSVHASNVALDLWRAQSERVTFNCFHAWKKHWLQEALEVETITASFVAFWRVRVPLRGSWDKLVLHAERVRDERRRRERVSNDTAHEHNEQLADLVSAVTTNVFSSESQLQPRSQSRLPRDGGGSSAEPAPMNDDDVRSLRSMFDHADANGDGTISVVELMVALRHDPELASMLRLPSHIHQEDGTRIAFERVFSEFDDDHDRLITWDEFLRHVASWRESPTMIGAQHDGTSAAIMNERRPGSRLVASIADGDVRSSRYVAGERPGLVLRDQQSRPRGGDEAANDGSLPSPEFEIVESAACAAATVAVRTAHAAVAGAQSAAMDAVRDIMEEVQRQLDAAELENQTTLELSSLVAEELSASAHGDHDALVAAKAKSEAEVQKRLLDQQQEMEAKLEKARHQREEDRAALEAEIARKDAEIEATVTPLKVRIKRAEAELAQKDAEKEEALTPIRERLAAAEKHARLQAIGMRLGTAAARTRLNRVQANAETERREAHEAMAMLRGGTSAEAVAMRMDLAAANAAKEHEFIASENAINLERSAAAKQRAYYERLIEQRDEDISAAETQAAEMQRMARAAQQKSAVLSLKMHEEAEEKLLAERRAASERQRKVLADERAVQSAAEERSRRKLASQLEAQQRAYQGELQAQAANLEARLAKAERDARATASSGVGGDGIGRVTGGATLSPHVQSSPIPTALVAASAGASPGTVAQVQLDASMREAQMQMNVSLQLAQAEHHSSQQMFDQRIDMDRKMNAMRVDFEKERLKFELEKVNLAAEKERARSEKERRSPELHEEFERELAQERARFEHTLAMAKHASSSVRERSEEARAVDTSTAHSLDEDARLRTLQNDASREREQSELALHKITEQLRAKEAELVAARKVREVRSAAEAASSLSSSDALGTAAAKETTARDASEEDSAARLYARDDDDRVRTAQMMRDLEEKLREKEAALAAAAKREARARERRHSRGAASGRSTSVGAESSSSESDARATQSLLVPPTLPPSWGERGAGNEEDEKDGGKGHNGVEAHEHHGFVAQSLVSGEQRGSAGRSGRRTRTRNTSGSESDSSSSSSSSSSKRRHDRGRGRCARRSSFEGGTPPSSPPRDAASEASSVSSSSAANAASLARAAAAAAGGGRASSHQTVSGVSDRAGRGIIDEDDVREPFAGDHGGSVTQHGGDRHTHLQRPRVRGGKQLEGVSNPHLRNRNRSTSHPSSNPAQQRAPQGQPSGSSRRGTYWGTYSPDYATEMRRNHRTASTVGMPDEEGYGDREARTGTRRGRSTRRGRGAAAFPSQQQQQQRGSRNSRVKLQHDARKPHTSSSPRSPLQLQPNGVAPLHIGSPKVVPVIVRKHQDKTKKVVVARAGHGRGAVPLPYSVPSWITNPSPPPKPAGGGPISGTAVHGSGVRGRVLNVRAGKKGKGKRKETTVAVHVPNSYKGRDVRRSLGGEAAVRAETDGEWKLSSAWGNTGYLAAHTRTGPPETWFKP